MIEWFKKRCKEFDEKEECICHTEEKWTYCLMIFNYMDCYAIRFGIRLLNYELLPFDNLVSSQNFFDKFNCESIIFQIKGAVQADFIDNIFC